MIDEKAKINNTSRILVNLSKKTKIIALVIISYFMFLVLYDLIVFDRTFKDIIITYLSVIIIGIFAWFGLRFVFWLQIKNRNCPEKYLNILVLVALIVFGVSSIFMGIQYFIDGFLISAFIAPIAFLSLIKVQFLRT